jgi:hypothetical protein
MYWRISRSGCRYRQTSRINFDFGRFDPASF